MSRWSPVFLSVAFALPPQISEHNWSKESLVERIFPRLQEQRAKDIQWLHRSPLGHGGLLIEDSKIRVLSPDGLEEFYAPLGSREFKKRSIKTKEAAKFFNAKKERGIQHKFGKFRLDSGKLHYVPNSMDGRVLWSIPIKDKMIRVEKEQGRPHMLALSEKPHHLYYLRWKSRSRRKEAIVDRIRWIEGGEPVRLFSCDNEKMILAENLVELRLVRLFFFDYSPYRGLQAKGFSLFDFSEENNKPELTEIVAKNCDDLYLGGSFGLARVRY